MSANFTFLIHIVYLTKSKSKIIHDLLYIRDICNIFYLFFLFTDDLSTCTSG